jgi:hypothetical protein
MALSWSTVMVGGDAGHLVTGRGKGEVLPYGAVFEYQSVFVGGERGDGVLAVCLRKGPAPRSYYIRPISAENEYMRWHLVDRDNAPSTILMRFANKPEDLKSEKLNGEHVEMSSAFRIFGIDDEIFDPEEIPWLEDRDYSRVKRDVAFTKDMLAAEAVPPREARLEEDESQLIKLNKWEFSVVTQVLVGFGCCCVVRVCGLVWFVGFV